MKKLFFLFLFSVSAYGQTNFVLWDGTNTLVNISAATLGIDCSIHTHFPDYSDSSILFTNGDIWTKQLLIGNSTNAIKTTLAVDGSANTGAGAVVWDSSGNVKIGANDVGGTLGVRSLATFTNNAIVMGALSVGTNGNGPTSNLFTAGIGQFLHVGTDGKVWVDNGSLTVGSGSVQTNLGKLEVAAGSVATPLFNFAGSTVMGFARPSSTEFDMSWSGASKQYFDANGFIQVPSAGGYQFGATANANSSTDTGLYKTAAGVAAFGTTSANNLAWYVWKGEARMTTNQTTTSVTMANCGFNNTLSLAAGRTYGFHAQFFLSDSVAVDGAMIDFDGGAATATDFVVQTTAFDTALNLSSQTTALATDISASTFTGAGAFECHGTITVNAAGTFIPRFAQVSHSTGTLTLRQGSRILMWDMP